MSSVSDAGRGGATSNNQSSEMMQVSGGHAGGGQTLPSEVAESRVSLALDKTSISPVEYNELVRRLNRLEEQATRAADSLTRNETDIKHFGQGITKLESTTLDVRKKAETVETNVSNMSGKLDLLVSQVISRLPSWWQMPAMTAAILTIIGTFLAVFKWLKENGLIL